MSELPGKLIPKEKEVVTEVLEKGTIQITPDNMLALANALIKVSPDVYKKLMIIIENDGKLQKEIASQISVSTQEAIKTTGRVSQKAVDNAYQNSQLIRELIRNGTVPVEEVPQYLDELRSYQDDINKESGDVRKSNEHMVAQQAEALENAGKESHLGRNIAISVGIGVGTVTVGSVIYSIIKSAKKR